MGRKSSLTPEQWIEIERRHVVDGESINALAHEFDINESSVRRKIKPNKAESKKGENPLKIIALEKVKADQESKRIAEKIAQLPYAKQEIVSELARRLTSISDHLASAAEYGAATAHRLSALANSEVQKIDDANPAASLESLKGVQVLTTLANNSANIGLNLLAANKDAAKAAQEKEIIDESIPTDANEASRTYMRLMNAS